MTYINLSDAVAKIINGPKSCTNPFLNGSFKIPESATNTSEETTEMLSGKDRISPKSKLKNPFSGRSNEKSQFFSFPDTVNSFNGNWQGNLEMDMSSEECALIQLDYVDKTDKYADSICADAFETLRNPQHKQFRFRSLSTVSSQNDKDLLNSENDLAMNPFVGKSIHKTVSDTQLEHIIAASNVAVTTTPTLKSYGKIQTKCVDVDESIQKSISSDNSDFIDLKRAMSYDSVNSDSSVVLADLEQQQTPSVTGQLCIGLQYDK